MASFAQELLTTEPNVAFRATDRHVHHTWAKTFQSRPELYITPQTVEEVQKSVTLARRCRRRIVVVGSGHSPSDLTCTSSWMMNLDGLSKIVRVNKARKTLLVEGGIRLRDLNQEANKHGLTMPNLGSINEQSIAGAIATATHGSSLYHGLLSDSVRSLRIVLSNGQAVRCSKDLNPDLFKAALISLGAIGIVVEVEFAMIDACNIEWTQTLRPLKEILDTWETTLWTQKEYTRVWWMPYTKRAIVWSAEQTSKPPRPPASSWYGGSIGYHTYHNLLWISNYIPQILPFVEWFVFGMQYGFKTGLSTTAIEPLQTGLLMNCLYSQFVNEWAIPLHRGPEAISRLSAWMNNEPGHGEIPFDPKGVWVHCPIEVRVSDTSKSSQPRPFLDNTVKDGPTLYLNATLYRPYLQDPPCRDRYYEAFEWLMREMDGKPHYAKNFTYTSAEYISMALGEGFQDWTRVRNDADPYGMFLGEWHKRTLNIGSTSRFALAETETSRTKARDGGQVWVGELQNQDVSVQEPSDSRPMTAGDQAESPSASSSASSFDMMHVAETEKSFLYTESDADDDEKTPGQIEARYHEHPQQGATGTAVFDKM